tara:strand:+ start:711 stop:962 length:252 start_codon:yes stop_codon:yes gene_type:complete
MIVFGGKWENRVIKEDPLVVLDTVWCHQTSPHNYTHIHRYYESAYKKDEERPNADSVDILTGWFQLGYPTSSSWNAAYPTLRP